MKIVKIPKKKKGEFRTIYVPNNELKRELRENINKLENILKSFERNGKIDCEVIHGFVSERSPVTNAYPHIGFKYTLSMDLEDFFDSVRKHHVQNLIPQTIIEKVFVDGSPKQGLPTSPIVSNIAAIKMDIAILKFLKKNNHKAVYTRYADDLSISFNDRELFETLKTQINSIVRRSGFKINASKTRLQSSIFGNREITGVMVGESGVSVSRKFKRRMRATKHQNNVSSYEGMLEWSKLKVPKTISEKHSTQQNTYETLKKNNRAKPPHFQIRELEEIRRGNVLITNDLGYLWGMSDLADGWTSCYRRTGVNKNAPIFISYFKSFVGVYLSPKTENYFGLKRNLIKARCIIYVTKGGDKVACQFYGARKYVAEIKKVLEEQNIRFITHGNLLNLKDGQVEGYGKYYKSRCSLYYGRKIKISLKNRRGEWAKILLK